VNTDLILVVGLVLVVLSVPAVFSAFSESRTPRVAAFTLIAGGSLMIWAVVKTPGGFAIQDIPNAVVRVVADILG